MATIKIKFRPSTVAGHEGTVYYQIIHERKARQLLSGYHVFPSEWDERRSMVVMTPLCQRKALILSIRERMRRDIERITRIIHTFEGGGVAYTVDDVIDEFHRYANEYTLFNFMGSLIAKLRLNGRIRTSETYTAALHSFKKFLANQASTYHCGPTEDIMLDCINSEKMEAYEAWLHNRGVTSNTISFYTRILRAVYRRAVEEDIIEDRSPFRHVYTGIDKTVKRALPLQTIKKIKTLDLSCNPALDYARDMFMMSFMLRGMSFIDMAYLRKADLINGHIAYRRRKTGQRLTIAWTADMQSILDKYPENSSVYLLPIIRHPDPNERSIYRNTGYNINRNLKAIAKMVDVTIPLTLYVARHSWASAAKSKGIPLSVISEGMGHDSGTTTQIYLASLDTSVVDKANALILKSI